MIDRNFPETKVVDDNEVINIIEKAPLSTIGSVCDDKSKLDIIKEIEKLLKQLI